MRVRFPLLAWVVMTLVAVGLLPVAMSAFLLRTNRDAVLDQMQRTQILAASTAAGRIEAWISSLRSAAQLVAKSPVILAPESVAAQELLRELLRSPLGLVAAGVFDQQGHQLVLAQKVDRREQVAALLALGPSASLELVRQADGTWTRLRERVPESQLDVVLVADSGPLAQIFDRAAIAAEAEMVLGSREGETLYGSGASLASFPADLVRQARSGKLEASGARVQSREGGDLVVAHYPVAGTPWFVLSRLPTRIADSTQARIGRASLAAALGALGLALVLSATAYFFVVRPMRRLAQAQAELAGIEAQPTRGSEIEQLRSGIDRLQRLDEDRESIGEVFLGRYQVLGVLGSGGQGQVFRGFDPLLNRPVALKVIHLDRSLSESEDFEKRLQIEAAQLARFHHPNIVSVYDYARSGDAGYIAMELVDGISLEVLMMRKRRLSVAETVPIGVAVATALVTAHGQDLIHGDLNPRNVLLGIDGSIKVVDFGTAQVVREAQTRGDAVFGTPGYVAPETVERGQISLRSDMFAFGALLFECLAGRHPFGADQRATSVFDTIRRDPLPLQSLCAEAPVDLVYLIEQLISRDPARRSEARVCRDYLTALAEERDHHWLPDADHLRPRLRPRKETKVRRFVTVRLDDDPAAVRLTS